MPNNETKVANALPTTSSLPQAGVQLVPATVRTATFGSRPSISDTPAFAKPLGRYLQARATVRWDNEIEN